MSNELKPIDWSKPIEHVRGIYQVKWLVSLQGSHSHRHVVLFSSNDKKSENVHHLNDYGRLNDTTPCVRNVPQRKLLFVLNIGKSYAEKYYAKESADCHRRDSCKAVITIYECDERYEAEVEHV